jgi:hypothetical protein
VHWAKHPALSRLDGDFATKEYRSIVSVHAGFRDPKEIAAKVAEQGLHQRIASGIKMKSAGSVAVA